MSKHLRRQLFVDAKVQGSLVLRVLTYWVCTIVTIVAMVLCWQIVTGPPRLFFVHVQEMWYQFGPAIVASVFLIPLMVVDCVRLTNRFTGPLYRLRRCLRELSLGQAVPNIHFRDGDYWQEVAEEFNAVNLRVQLLERELAALKGEPESPPLRAPALTSHADE